MQEKYLFIDRKMLEFTVIRYKIVQRLDEYFHKHF